MSVVRQTVRQAAIGVAVAERPENLSAFLQPGCAAAIWRRQPTPAFQSWIDALNPETLPQGRLVLPANEVRRAITDLCEIAQTPDGSQRDILIDDVAALADLFADMMDVSHVRLRLDVVDTDACRKFHIDALTARLICTYRGTGTQYAISTKSGEPTRIFTVPTGAPILLRGTLWPTPPPSGLLHRSPPIEGTGETRFMLVLDPVSAPQPVSRQLH